MALRDQPYFPLYVQDFLTDEKLAECSAESTGVYIRLMCLMHKSEEYGKILLQQKYKQSEQQVKNFATKLAKNFPYTVAVIERALEELIEEKVIEIDGDYLIQKRMVKDNEISLKRANAGSKGGKKTAKKTKELANDFANDFATAKLQANTENEYEYENEYENEIKNENELKEKKKRTTKPKDPKHKYGEYQNVLLTDKEYEKLFNEFMNAQELITYLDEYIEMKGYKAQSHYLAIRKWVIDAVQKDKTKSSTFTQFNQNYTTQPKSTLTKLQEMIAKEEGIISE